MSIQSSTDILSIFMFSQAICENSLLYVYKVKNKRYLEVKHWVLSILLNIELVHELSMNGHI